MDAIKQTAMSVSLLGIIMTITGLICPKEKTEEYLKLIIGAILIIVTAKGIAGFDLSDLSESEGSFSEITENYSDNTNEYYARAAEKNLSRTLTAILLDEKINAEITCDIDISENGGIYINKVTAETEKSSERERITKIIRNAVGEEVTIYVKDAEE